MKYSVDAAPLVKVSWGEIIDKITILRIKVSRLSNPEGIRNSQHELDTLESTAGAKLLQDSEVAKLIDGLTTVNEKLWVVEDDLREHERNKDFGPEFVELARAVYHTNDKRAALKREINNLLKSEIVEEKSYEKY